MHSPFVTEFVDEQPLVIVVGNHSRLTKNTVKLISEQHLQVLHLTPQEISHQGQLDLLSKAYKIVWVNEFRDKNNQAYVKTVAALKKSQTLPIIIQPFFTSIKAPREHTKFGYDWAQTTESLSDVILDINTHFPTSSFVFGQDIIDSTDLSLSPLYFALANIQKGEISDPEIYWNPQSVDSFISNLVTIILRPQTSGSVLVKASGQNSSYLLQQIKSKYEQYHDASVFITSEPQVNVASLPFSVTEVQSDGLSSDLYTKIARNLPQPLHSGIPRNKSELEGSLQKPSARVKEVKPIKLTEKIPNNTPLVEETQPVELTQEVKTSRTPSSPKEKGFDVNDELQKIFSTTRSKQKIGRVKNKAKTEKHQRKKTKQRTALFWGGVVSIGLAISIIILSGVYATTQFFMKKSLMSVVAGAAKQQSINLIGQDNWSEVETTAKILNLQTDAYSSLFDTSVFTNAALLIELSEQMKTMVVAMDNTQKTSQTLVLQILGRERGDISQTADNLQTEANKAYENLSLLQAGLEQAELSNDDEAANELISQYESKVRDLRQGLAIVQQLKPHLADLTGINGKKTYALLLQNNQELRPTGGFIQSIALLNFDRGSLVSYQVYSSYELDKKFAGVVAPPEDIVTYLGEENWYLRDSNWDPHFPASASKISWFVEKSLGVQIDGVLGMNLLTMEDLITALGPIDLAEYNETLTDRNLQERMEFHSEVVLVPQDNTRDYSTVVLEKLVEKIKQVQDQKVSTLLSALAKNLSTQQLTITLFDEDAQDTFTTLGWTGGLINPECPSQFSTDNCQVDSIAQVEANVGINKANYYLKRSIDHTISLSTDVAEHQRIITFENTAQSNAWPKGSYKSFIRFYLPVNAKFNFISIDGNIVPTNQIVSREENGKSVVGLLLEVPIKSTKKLSLNYSAPLNLDQPFSYTFFNQKQSGTSDTPISVKIVAPSSLQPVLIAPQAEVVDNTIIFDNINDKHSFVGVNFQ